MISGTLQKYLRLNQLYAYKRIPQNMRKTNGTRATLFTVTWIGWITLFVSGCNPSIPAQSSLEPVTGTETQITPILPIEGEAAQMTPSLPIPADPSLQSLVDKAIANLAQRLTISATEIILLEATSVIWSDSSLGCPQPGMFYTQVLTDGYLIRLETDGKMYEYHANRDTYVFLCENPSSPVPGIPGDR